MTEVTEKDITQWVIEAKKELEELRAFKQQVRELSEKWEEDESTHSAPYSHYRNGNQCANELKALIGDAGDSDD